MLSHFLILFSSLLISIVSFAEVKGLACGGTEPFWSLDIDATNGKMHFSSPENMKGSTFAVTPPLKARGIQDTLIMVFKGIKSDVSATAISSAIAGKCNDGMSDTEYSYHVIYTNRKVVRYGCCDLKAQE